ncbi:hypothetical protein ON010_g12392 [Phytophthora cinnamomi]|nr:hypothetical protein ON010_g12392 [Phytophthora cinnamomi]
MTEILDAYSLFMNVTRFNIDSDQHVWLTGNDYASAEDLEGEYLGDVLNAWLAYSSTPEATTATPTSTPAATTAAPHVTTATPTLTPTVKPTPTTASSKTSKPSASSQQAQQAQQLQDLKQLMCSLLSQFNLRAPLC